MISKQPSKTQPNFPEDLFVYYANNPTRFGRRINRRRHNIYYAIVALALLLMIFPGLIPIDKTIIVRLLSFAAIVYVGITIYSGGREWYSIATGGRIVQIAKKHFARPMKHIAPGGSEDQRILAMFTTRNWAALANEPVEKGNPMHLWIHEAPLGRTFYLQVCRDKGPGLLPSGISDVQIISEQEYTLHYDVIKSIR